MNTQNTNNQAMNTETTFQNQANLRLPLDPRLYNLFQYAATAFATHPEQWAFLIGATVADLLPASSADWTPLTPDTRLPEEGSTAVAYSATSGTCAFATVRNGILVAPLADITHFLPLPPAPLAPQAPADNQPDAADQPDADQPAEWTDQPAELLTADQPEPAEQQTTQTQEHDH